MLLTGLALAAQVGGAGFAAAAATRPDIEPTVRAAAGQLLPMNPVLLRGQQVVVRADGFAAATRVAIRLAGTAPTNYAHADDAGVLTLHYPIATSLADGAYVLTLVGSPGAPTSGTPQDDDAPPSRAGSPFVFLVPRVWLFHFQVAASTGSHRPPTGSGTGAIAYTGVDVLALLAIAAGLVAIGALIVRTARRP